MSRNNDYGTENLLDYLYHQNFKKALVWIYQGKDNKATFFHQLIMMMMMMMSRNPSTSLSY